MSKLINLGHSFKPQNALILHKQCDFGQKLFHVTEKEPFVHVNLSSKKNPIIGPPIKTTLIFFSNSEFKFGQKPEVNSYVPACKVPKNYRFFLILCLSIYEN